MYMYVAGRNQQSRWWQPLLLKPHHVLCVSNVKGDGASVTAVMLTFLTPHLWPSLAILIQHRK